MFTEYEHMENHYNLSKICNLSSLDPTIEFVCTEKIHGTNYSFLCDESSVTPCKRGSTLEATTSFMNHNFVFEKYKNDVLKIFEQIKKEYSNLQYIQLYGELFGGSYDGKAAQGHKKIQPGVNYCDKNDFMAYDLKIVTSEKTFYYDFDKLVFLLVSTSIKLVPIIKKGTLDELLKLNPAFESVVYSYYDLPKLKDNYAEGYVVKSVKEMLMPPINVECSGGTVINSDATLTVSDSSSERMIFKFKNPSFSEIAVVPENKANKQVKSEKPKYIDILRTYVTQMRFDNVNSKLADNEKNKLHEMFYNDVMVDFTRDVDNINEKDLELCKKQLNGLVASFLSKQIN